MKRLNLKFFKKIGFYFSLISIVTLIMATISYINGFTDNLLEYNDSNVMVAVIVGICAFVALLLFKPTANYAPIVLFGGAFASFLLYIKNIYMYFTGIFYNGISAEAFALIDPIVFKCTIMYVVACVIANIAMYMKHSVEEDKKNEKV